ncbi:cyclic peptide export ABC transporter [Opitutus terrae]|uniref:Cyclic peptide transporter n=1 Tax=Opitutus terrae (strain DSM 11246 / JCM 15787 / PB90-1) TaxID=452637 RepID=B1ZYK3_OPITP|nr:cyclic peptide export ABC transporter [Opitutus terrae]ACB75239.1 cyclic peptide transporter [Opitutus terrae PB90-1]
MEFLRFLQRESGAIGRRIALVTLLGGAVSGLMVTIILGAASAATAQGESFRYLLLFLIALVAMMTAKRYSLRHTGELTEGIVERLRLRVADKIRRAELLFFESTGPAQFTTLLTKETQTISSTVSMAINASASAVMLLVAFLFIAYLSVPAFLLTLGAMATAVIAYRWSLSTAEPQLQQTLEMEVGFFGLIEHLLDGFKELKVDARKNRDLFDNHLRPLATKVTNLKVETNNSFVTTTLITHSAFYGLLGVIIFLLPRFAQAEGSVVIKISTVILFIFGPMAEVVGVVPYIAKAAVAIRAIETMESKLDDELSHVPTVNFADDPAPLPLREIEVRDLVFSYKNPDGTPGYTVGPLNVTIPLGEVLFIQGGNGGGKSTFLKLLTGLYQPAGGALYLNGHRLQPSQYHRYRNMFSVIFTDFHLFDRLYGLQNVDEDRLNERLQEMELDAKTSYYEGRFSTLNLSTGQRKRLSLIIALLDDKPILVFDEWAADQDPIFRRHFYEVILPELKRQGKTIIAATHDDRYFSAADRVLKMEYGRFVNGAPK